jgi:DNA-binding SARP family transcriptional activator
VIARVVAAHPALGPALEAGRAAALHLTGGDRVAARHRAYLPATWCEDSAAIVQITLLGGAAVRRDRVPVRHKAWDRARVRELCCYLALVGDGSRELAAERLWPELDGPAAARNLRVTLSYLLDVLDPGRPRGGSDLLDTSFTFARTPRLRIDLRDAGLHAGQIVTLAAAGDTVGVMEHARRLDRLPLGALMGGAPLGEWVETIDRDRRDAMLRAVGVACTIALREGDPELAASLARRGLDEDPWAERLHQVVVRARLAMDDLDGARRAVAAAVHTLDELGVRPEQATVELARQAGVELPGS